MKATVVKDQAHLGPVVLGLAIPAIVLESQNLMVFASVKAQNLNYITAIHYVGLLILLIICAAVAHESPEAAVACGLGALLAIAIEVRFRGAAIRPGTFDLFESSIRRWGLWTLGTTIAGILLGVGLKHWDRRSWAGENSRAWLWVAIIGLAIAAAASGYATLRLSAASMSAFAPTKYMALAVLTVLATLCLAWDKRRSK
ncbi:MAG TPA: hypothetical protein PLH94_14695 [Fimbriimonadaceae bacterium]|nr:hypothetical protein [Fimbriimonadaceae bacterium]